MSLPRGSVMPIHHVNCLACGIALERKTYWRKPQCSRCRLKKTKGHEANQLKHLRQQARRYRILLHILGWELDDFDSLLDEIKHSPMAFRRRPETRSARYDIALERRT